MSKEVRTESERLIAEQAVAMYREVQKATESASHGQGMAVTEEAVLRHGRKLMGAHAEAQKRGPVAGGVLVEETPRSSTTRRKGDRNRDRAKQPAKGGNE